MNTPTREITLDDGMSRELAAIYREMEQGYDRVAAEIGLTCQGCPDNCCDSWFLHHTYSEWAYLWQGLRQLEEDRRRVLIERAEDYVRQSRALLDRQQRPQIMCPLNEDGLCVLYHHRMLVCRMHGIPALMTRPDGQSMRFPGCFRCQEIVAGKYERDTDAPAMDRTPLFRRMAALEGRLLGERRRMLPRVKKTIAEMIVLGPPRAEVPFCGR